MVISSLVSQSKPVYGPDFRVYTIALWWQPQTAGTLLPLQANDITAVKKSIFFPRLPPLVLDIYKLSSDFMWPRRRRGFKRKKKAEKELSSPLQAEVAAGFIIGVGTSTTGSRPPASGQRAAHTVTCCLTAEQKWSRVMNAVYTQTLSRLWSLIPDAPTTTTQQLLNANDLAAVTRVLPILPTCVFSEPTWVYWPRLYPGDRSSGTLSPAGCCRNSAWSSVCVTACCRQPPPPAVSPLEGPNLVGDAEALSHWNQNISSRESREGNPTVSHAAFTLSLLFKSQNRGDCYITTYHGGDLHWWTSTKSLQDRNKQKKKT